MTRRRWISLGLGLITLATIITLIYGEALREQLLRYLVYEVWVWGVRMASLPLGLVWMLFVIGGSLGVYMTILDLVLHGRKRAASSAKVLRAGPVQTLVHKIELACHGELGRWNLHRFVGEIAVQWVALREGISEHEARRRFQVGAVLPDLRTALDLEFPRFAGRQGWLWVSGRLNPRERRRRLEELSRLTDILERFAGEAYEGARDRR
ncbi:MAG: hypothetical protein NZ930_04125 [Candidatus Bipolaricaulota bacterium]|nr:hypothetical protein [Candidatus Bipolaricaulota bacterium]MDW8031362.1 hypothetical protein [Candidatus Bipolaricaulota bacterium]